MDLINWSLSAIDTIFSRRSLIEAMGRAVSNETDYKPEYGCHHVETHGFASEN